MTFKDEPALTHLGSNSELGNNDCHGVGVLRKLPGAGKFQHLFIGVCGVAKQGLGIPQALD